MKFCFQRSVLGSTGSTASNGSNNGGVGQDGKKMMHHCHICSRGFLNKSNIKVCLINNYPCCRIDLLVKIFVQLNQDKIKYPKVFKPMNKRMCL